MESYDVVTSADLAAIRQLNALRNECSHQKSKVITGQDLDRIGQPYGKKYTDLRVAEGPDLGSILRSLLIHLHVKLLVPLAALEIGQDIRGVSAEPGT